METHPHCDHKLLTLKPFNITPLNDLEHRSMNSLLVMFIGECLQETRHVAIAIVLGRNDLRLVAGAWSDS